MFFSFKNNRKRGSSVVVLSMVFMALISVIVASISIARDLVIKSECEAFGQLWCKAILSEYDVHLMEDYNIMAFWGNDSDIQSKLDYYISYSMADKLDASVNKCSVELSGTELGNPDNFRKALKKGFSNCILKNCKRTERDLNEDEEKEFDKREIKNKVVLDTLPSSQIDGVVSNDSIIKKIKNGNFSDYLKNKAINGGVELTMIYKCFDNHVTSVDDKKHFMRNEWEYIICGNANDDTNFKKCRRKLLIIRNAMNLAYLYSDPEKSALLKTAAELITPGPESIITKALIAEAWALIESENDIRILLKNGRVPVVKTDESWQTDISGIFDSDELIEKLDDESKKQLSENENEIESMKGARSIASEIKDGQTYDDYLMLMLISMNENTRLLRTMDIIQINMKFRYYKDFNMMEYHTSVSYSIKANYRNYEFNESYK